MAEYFLSHELECTEITDALFSHVVRLHYARPAWPGLELLP